MEQIGKAIKCHICKKILKSAVILPCGESVCQIHVAEKKQIFCIVCEKDHLIPIEGLASNKAIDIVIQTNIDKCDFGIEYKNASNGCKNVEKLLEEIDLMNRDPCFYICEMIGELKRDVDMKREELKSKIDDEAEELMNKLNKYENECKSNLKVKEFLVKANKINENANEVREKLKVWSNDLRSLETNEIKWKCLTKDLKIIMNDLKEKLRNLKQELLLNRKININVEKSEGFITISTNQIPTEIINFDSKIVDLQLTKDLFKLCEFPDNQKWSLLFRASDHEFDVVVFHDKCDNKPNTLTIIKSSSGNIFGGYADQCWESDELESIKSDPNAFLFSFINLPKQPKKIKVINTNNSEPAIFTSLLMGPAFGKINLFESPDLQVNATMRNGRSCLNTCYYLSDYPEGSNGSNFLAGSEFFEITDFEVFMKN